MDRFQPVSDVAITKSRLAHDPGWCNITMLGALALHKGHKCFIRMAGLILGRLPDTEFHITGRGQVGHEDYPESVRRHATELGVAARIRFWGFVEGQLARNLLCASDLFVLPAETMAFLCMASSRNSSHCGGVLGVASCHCLRAGNPVEGIGVAIAARSGCQHNARCLRAGTWCRGRRPACRRAGCLRSRVHEANP